jgi:hypothetical protein
LRVKIHSMRLLVLYLWALSVFGAVIQGVVLDEESGNPLARTFVLVSPLPGTSGGRYMTRAGERGAFAINNVGPGWYVLRCTRKAFVPAEVGQLRPGRPGMPFEITPDSQSSFFQIRMRRLGAVTGSVLDENNVGIPEWPVHLYTAKKPVRHVAETKTDDRGNYRIGELDGGNYIVRSGPGQLEDESYLLPTYYKFGTALETAEATRVRVGETQSDLVLRPVKGREIQISGVFSSQWPATLTLITDTGRHVLVSGSAGPPTSFSIPVTPGQIEFLAEGTGARCGGYVRMFADHDMQGIRIACSPLDPAVVNWMAEGHRGYFDGRQFSLMMRRVDLDGTGPPRAVKQRDPIVPGHWEFQAQVSDDYYVKSIGSQFNGQSESTEDGWFGLDLGTSSQIVVTLSGRPGSVSGLVTTGGKPVAGAAVYLELFDPQLPNPRVRIGEARCDAQGNYKFSGLAPGSYRALSSFDFDPEDRLAMEKAIVITLREGDNATQALDLVLP